MFTERPCMRRFVECTTTEPLKPLLWGNETIDYELVNLELCFNPKSSTLGKGSLYITNKRVIWLGLGDVAYDFDVPYIVLFAITKDVESYCKPCIYCQLDYDCDENDIDDNNEEDIIDEMYLVPENENDLMLIFNALSIAALKNPDPPEEGEKEGDDELIFNTEEVELGAKQAKTLQHLESVFQIPDNIEENNDNTTI